MYRLLTAFEETAADAPPETVPSISSTMALILIALLFGSGIYALYTYFRLRKTYELFSNKFMYPGNCATDNCVDPDGFIDYMLPRLLLLGIVMVLFGIAYTFYCVMMQPGTLLLDIVSLIIPIGIFVWYMLVQRKASREFW